LVAYTTVTTKKARKKWLWGKPIYKEEQQGRARADNGDYLIQNLAKTIESAYGSGFGVR
jgi:hypothetical protein